MNFKDVFLQHIGRSWDKQMTLSELIGGSPHWEYDLAAGTLAFQDSYTFKIQLIGTEGWRSNTWLWAWANTGSHFPSNLVQASLDIKAFGVKNRIMPLRTAKLPLGDRINGSTLSLLACGICQGDAIYRGPDDKGALFMLIKDDAYPLPTYHPIQRVAEIFPRMIGSVHLDDPRTALKHYLESYGLTPQIEGKTLVAQHSDGSELRATFDTIGRLQNFEAKLKP